MVYPLDRHINEEKELDSLLDACLSKGPTLTPIQVCYWLAKVWYAIGVCLYLCDIHMCGYYIDTDAFMSMLTCYYINTFSCL